MKMAKANQADIDAAMKITSLIESLERGYFSTDMREDDRSIEDAIFDSSDAIDCKRAIEYLLDLSDKGSIARVVWGMYLLLDPKNEAIDPDLDYIEHHPKRVEGNKAIGQRDELIAAMRIIAGQAQCADNLMSNADIALEALAKVEAKS